MSESVHCRQYRASDYDQAREVFAMVYGGGRIPGNDYEIVKDRTDCLLAEMDGRIVGVLRVHDLPMYIRGQLHRSGAVAGVGVLHSHRRLGVGSKLMEFCVEWMRKQGFLASGLYAFREPFYRKFGYEVAGERVEIRCPAHRLPSVASALSIREVRAAEWRMIQPCYEVFASQLSGSFQRTDVWWNRNFKGDTPTIIAAGDPVEGYVVGNIEGEFWKPQSIDEVAWSTPGGYRAVLSILRSIGINKTELTWQEPPFSPFLSHFRDQGVTGERTKFHMVRALDLEVILRDLPSESKETVSVRVVDEQVPQHAGPWRIAGTGRLLQVAKVASAEIDIHVRHLTQMVFGWATAKQMAAVGAIHGPDRAIEALDDLFEPYPCCCMDNY